MATRRSNYHKHNPSLYRSGLEDKNADHLRSHGTKFEYETLKVPYVQPSTDHVYSPDFIVTTNSGKQIIVETKGRWDYKDRLKHLLVREQHPDLDIRFVFTRSKSKISKGSKTTYGDICSGLGRGKFKGIEWLFADKLIPIEWLLE